ncbi:uncharacterized protein H6S33_009921 [Morchella sextelata]|uniref:uncharacterized protein n=1 Tax=Morchella sextelata TaxID=1174677 RepID=UPI001D036F7D|nr:uncharacterized protein H6S33_009921 [Morchella sextelata]KAH0602222.1 hypothetical protein H6S33_009921 [Morchella sextelata]
MTTPTKSLEASTLSLLTLISHSRSRPLQRRHSPSLQALHRQPTRHPPRHRRPHARPHHQALHRDSATNIIYDAAARCVQDIMQAADNTLAALEEFAKEIPEICRCGQERVWPRDRLASTGVLSAYGDAERCYGRNSRSGLRVTTRTKMMRRRVKPRTRMRFWDAPKKALSKDDTEAREKVDASLKKMKLATILLGAVVKRRLAGEGKLQDAQRLDKIAELAKSAEDAKEFEKKAIELAELATLANDGNDDSFSKWFRELQRCNFKERLIRR